MSSEWVIEVQWGYGSIWSALGTVGYPTKKEAEDVIDALRRRANLSDCPPYALAYRTIPLRAAQRELGAE
jgi:hypothetical protein